MLASVRSVFLVILGSLVFAPPALAHEWNGRRALTVAEHRAESLWHERPCDGIYHVALTSFTTADVAGYAYFDTPNGPGLYTSPPSTWTNCVLALRAADWSSPTQVAFNWPQLCTIVLHEWGHLTGHVHSNEPPFVDAPGVPADTREQATVMRSGSGSTTSDLHRCGWSP